MAPPVHGSDDINLSAATIEWIGPDAAKTLTYDSGAADANNFNVTSIKDGDSSVPVLNTQNDRFTVTMNAAAIEDNGGLGEGESVKLTTQYGAVTLYRANIPQSLSQESAVTV